MAAYFKIRYHDHDVPVRVEIFGKPECGLCDEAKAVLLRLQSRHGFDLVVIDVSAHPELLQKYGEEIPVVFVGGRKAFKFHVDETEFTARLARAQGDS